MFFLSVFNWAEKDAEKGLELENLDIAEAPEDDDDNGDGDWRGHVNHC